MRLHLLSIVLNVSIWLAKADKSQYPSILQLLGVTDSVLLLEPPIIDDIRDHVQFLLHTRKTVTAGANFDLTSHALKTSSFENQKPVKILIHGFLGQLRDGWMTTAKNALLRRDDVNVVLVGWTNITKIFQYPWVVEQSYRVAKRIGELIDFLAMHGTSRKDIHIIGHSVGAHIAGVASKAASTGPVGHITGLDAAYPLYVGRQDAHRLDASDADFVDCIHTSSGVLGIPEPFCDADFYPNGGTPNQPGCDALTLVLCSHLRSHEYFVESIDPKRKFKALSCHHSALLLDCFDEGAVMGYPYNKRYTGIFYVPTGSQKPYSEIPLQDKRTYIAPIDNKFKVTYKYLWK